MTIKFSNHIQRKYSFIKESKKLTIPKVTINTLPQSNNPNKFKKNKIFFLSLNNNLKKKSKKSSSKEEKPDKCGVMEASIIKENKTFSLK